MALVVYVFATVLMMSEGIRSTLVATGQPDNVMVLRQGAGAEINSAHRARPGRHPVPPCPASPPTRLGRPLLSAEPVVLINLPKRSNGKPSNVTVRGTSDIGLQLRPGVRIVEGPHVPPRHQRDRGRQLSVDIDEQLQWLVGEDPDYLMSYATNVQALASRSLQLGLRLPRLRQVRTYGEMLRPEARGSCAKRGAWRSPTATVRKNWVTSRCSARRAGTTTCRRRV